MSKRKPLEWFGDEDGRLGFPACDKCFDYMTQPGMIEACASVGIEHGKSTGLMLRDAVNHFHVERHPKRLVARTEELR